MCLYIISHVFHKPVCSSLPMCFLGMPTKKNILLIMLTFTKQIKQQSTLGDNRYLLKLDFERPMTRLTGSAC